MEDIIELRCKYCGAPLDEDQVRSDSQYVTCSSCGTTQQRIDAKAYIDHLMGQVRSWISSAVPMGFNVAGAENIDPVARHSIFVKDVRPKVELEMGEFRFSNMSLLGNCLIALPFTSTSAYRPVHSASRAFEFNAKVKSVSALAVDQESRDLIENAASLSQSYAMMINNIELLAEDKEGRYILMANNFSESANVLRNVEGREPVRDRFDALALVCSGIDDLLSGKVSEAAEEIGQGRDMLVSVKDAAFTSPEYGIMVHGISQEISICDILLNIADMASTSSSKDPMRTVAVISKIIGLKLPGDQRWAYLFNDSARMNEILVNVDAVMDAKSGSGTVRTVPGKGSVLVP